MADFKAFTEKNMCFVQVTTLGKSALSMSGIGLVLQPAVGYCTPPPLNVYAIAFVPRPLASLNDRGGAVRDDVRGVMSFPPLLPLLSCLILQVTGCGE